MTWSVGQRVRATRDIVDDDPYAAPTQDARPCTPGWVYAHKDEEGEIVHWHEGVLPTVMFDRSRTATIVLDWEISLIE